MSARPTLRQLNYLCAVAGTLHFGRAAKTCHVTQSTLSADINELEITLGASLLERNNKQVLLTDVGKNILDRACDILARVDELVAAASHASAPLCRPLHVGIIPTIAPFMLPGLLSGLRKHYPKLQLLIREDLSHNLVQRLQQGELDVILLALPYPADNLTTYPLFNDPLLLACPKNHPLNKSGPVSVRDLKGQDILLLEDGHCLRDHILDACKLTPRQISQPWTGTSLHTIVQMVANDIGITLLPKMAFDTGILSGTRLTASAFREKNISRSIGLAWRKSSPNSAEYVLLADYIINSEKQRVHRNLAHQ